MLAFTPSKQQRKWAYGQEKGVHIICVEIKFLDVGNRGRFGASGPHMAKRRGKRVWPGKYVAMETVQNGCFSNTRPIYNNSHLVTSSLVRMCDFYFWELLGSFLHLT